MNLHKALVNRCVAPIHQLSPHREYLTQQKWKGSYLTVIFTASRRSGHACPHWVEILLAKFTSANPALCVSKLILSIFLTSSLLQSELSPTTQLVSVMVCVLGGRVNSVLQLSQLSVCRPHSNRIRVTSASRILPVFLCSNSSSSGFPIKCIKLV